MQGAALPRCPLGCFLHPQDPQGLGPEALPAAGLAQAQALAQGQVQGRGPEAQARALVRGRGSEALALGWAWAWAWEQGHRPATPLG